jgi:ribosomal RNA-processing protein 12
VCELLLRLYPLRQPLLHRHTTDTLLALTSSSASHLPPAALADVLTAVLSSESAWDKNDADAALALIRLVEQAALRLAAVDFCAASAILPRVCHALVPLLASHQEGVRRAASFALCNVLASNCVNESAIKDALTTENPPRGRKPASLQRVAAAIESSLGPQYSDAWEHALPVAAELIERLGLNGASLANGILLRIGHLCAGGDDVAAEMEACGGGVCDEERVMTAAQNALGRALRAIGPEAVLETLPLALEEGLAGSDEARTWLLPLLRMHVRGARLEYWAAYMLPLAQRMGARAAHASRDAARNREAQICGALEAQIWATLPSFCSWAEDVAECFR